MSILIEELSITIGGVNYDTQYIYSNIRLHQELIKPNELRFHLTKNTLVEEESDLKVDISSSLLGKEIQFSLTTFRDDEGKSGNRDVLKFSGIVFGVKALRKKMGFGLIHEIVAYSPDHLLQDNAHCNSYENTTLTAVASDVISGCGNIPQSVKPKMTQDIPYVVQYNETNYEFLSRLARRYGEWFYNDGSQLIFGELEKKAKIDLVPGFDILNYEYEMGVQHSKITHARHNYLDYQNTQATSPSGGGSHHLAGFASSAGDSTYKKTTFRNYHSSVAEENGLDEVEHSTKAQAKGTQAGTMSCRVTSNRCDLQIGNLVKIKEYYDPGTGEESEFTHEELLICGITHYADNDGSYQNEFIALDSGVEYPPYAFGDLYPLTESQRAVVKDNKDPEQLGRVRVQFLWQEEQDNSQMTPWIRIAQPHGGGDKGFYFIPEIDEEVIVGFENGNAEKPYVIGTLYHGQAKPPGSWYNEEDNIKAIRTRSGHTLEFHDTDGEEFIKIYDNEKDNFILTFSTFEKLIKLQSKGNIELYADDNIIMKAGKNIEMEADIDIKSKAGRDIFETAGDNNTIEIGKNRAITVGNNISEKAGDDNIIDIGKNRTITVGNNISEKAGDNNTIEIGKNRTIIVGNNISEKAADNISIDAGQNRTITVGNNISETAGANISLHAKSNINENAGVNVSIEAGSNILEKAADSITISAASGNIDENAGADIAISAGKNLRESVGQDRTVSVSSNDNLNVAKNIDIFSGENMDITTTNNYTMQADNIKKKATGTMKIYSAGAWEQKSDSSMKLDGGNSADIKAGTIKIN